MANKKGEKKQISIWNIKKFNIILVLLFNLILILSLFGCGGGSNEGIPGNTGISDVNMKIYIASASHIISDGINEKESNYWMIDINKSICKYEENNNEPVYENTYGSDFIRMNILSVPTEPLNSEIINKKLTITNYTVTFYPVDVYNVPIKAETYASQIILSSSYYERKSEDKEAIIDKEINQNNNDKFGPYIPSVPDFKGYTFKSVDNINNFLVFSMGSKKQLYDAIFINETYSRKYLPYKYVMIITFRGQNENGKKFEFMYETTIELDDFKIFC